MNINNLPPGQSNQLNWCVQAVQSLWRKMTGSNETVQNILNTIGKPNGISSLNSNGKVPPEQLDFTALDYKGFWNANTNSPTIANNTGQLGDLYVVSVAGTQNLGAGNITFAQGDLVIHNGTTWQDVGSVVNLIDYYTKEQCNALFATISSLSTVATSGSYTDLDNKPSIPSAQVQSDWLSDSGITEILNKPNLSTVAISGSYNDLSSKPSIPAAQINSDWNSISGLSELLNKPSLSAVAISGSYSDLSSKPTIPVIVTGIYSTTGVALQVVYQFPHSLGYNPSYIGIQMTTLGAAAPYALSWDGTNITVTYVASPGVVSLALKWFSIK